MDLKELGDARDALMAELDQEDRLEAAYKSAVKLDALYAAADEADHARRVDSYAREIARLSQTLIDNRPKNAEGAIEWAAQVMVYVRAVCSEWTAKESNAQAAWDLSSDYILDLYDSIDD